MLSSNPAIPLFVICPRELKTYLHTKVCTWMLIVALFMIGKKWTQPKLMNGSTKGSTTHTNLENTMASERSLANKCHISSDST